MKDDRDFVKGKRVEDINHLLQYKPNYKPRGTRINEKVNQVGAEGSLEASIHNRGFREKYVKRATYTSVKFKSHLELPVEWILSEFLDTKFALCSWINCDLQGITFNRCKFHSCTMSHCTLNSVKFVECSGEIIVDRSTIVALENTKVAMSLVFLDCIQPKD